jgi:PPK2 family polyphosphate:nucleotide phosphotransferase
MPAAATDLHLALPGSPIDLTTIDPRDAGAAPGDRATTAPATAALQQRLQELHDVLWAQGRHRVLVILQGIDTSGKGGAIKALLREMNPSGVRVAVFKAPTEPELRRDYLWRIHAQVPANGEIVVFDRSHYEDVLVVRVRELVDRARWQRRYDHINDFERMLTDEGTTIVKLFLHISHEEQRDRLQARVDDPTKRWKFLPEDLEERARWDDYQRAFEDVIERTSTRWAPWHVIPADRKWYRNWAACTILAATLERLDLSYPAVHPGCDGLQVR